MDFIAILADTISQEQKDYYKKEILNMDVRVAEDKIRIVLGLKKIVHCIIDRECYDCEYKFE